MKWSEVDLDARVWTIPASRTKTQHEHRVPFSDRAVELLKIMEAKRQRVAGGDYVWPGQRPNTHISPKALYLYLTRRMGVKVTIHGFRSTFRDWAGNETSFDRVTCELGVRTQGRGCDGACISAQ